VSDLLAAHGGGIAAAQDSEKEIAEAMATLHAAWRDGTLEARYGSGRLRRVFSQESVVAAYRAVADEVAGSAHAA
jgi:plasmid stabilization system protein ParE